MLRSRMTRGQAVPAFTCIWCPAAECWALTDSHSHWPHPAIRLSRELCDLRGDRTKDSELMSQNLRRPRRCVSATGAARLCEYTAILSASRFFCSMGFPGSRQRGQVIDRRSLPGGIRVIGVDRPGIGLSTFQPEVAVPRLARRRASARRRAGARSVWGRRQLRRISLCSACGVMHP